MPEPAPTLRVPQGQHRGHQASALAGGLPAPPKHLPAEGWGGGPGLCCPMEGEAALGGGDQLRMGRWWSVGWGQQGRAEAMGKAMTELLCALALP